MVVVGGVCRMPNSHSGPPAMTSCQNRAHLPCTFKKEICSSNVLEHALMMGTMHWGLRQLVQVLRQSIYERKYPKITNGNSVKGFVSELGTIKKLWQDQNPTWPWGRGRWRSLRLY
jgi:hypothetical protein